MIESVNYMHSKSVAHSNISLNSFFLKAKTRTNDWLLTQDLINGFHLSLADFSKSIIFKSEIIEKNLSNKRNTLSEDHGTTKPTDKQKAFEKDREDLFTSISVLVTKLSQEDNKKLFKLFKKNKIQKEASELKQSSNFFEKQNYAVKVLESKEVTFKEKLKNISDYCQKKIKLNLQKATN